MMQIIKDPNLLKKILGETKKKINFVPTMGGLHKGHINLIKKATKKTQLTLVSIFVNPLQFNNKKDFKDYPRSIESDLDILKKLCVDLVFVPSESFTENISCSWKINQLNKVLCGYDRPGHFEGVILIVSRLLKLINPDFLFLGEKDFQQMLIVKKLVNQFFSKTKLILVPTVRDASGLALSSRNKLISKNKKISAKKIFKTLNIISRKIQSSDGLKKIEINFYKKKMLKEGIQKVNYLEILSEKDLGLISNKFCKARIFISVYIDKIRLIDNLSIKKKIRLIDEKYLTY